MEEPLADSDQTSLDDWDWNGSIGYPKEQSDQSSIIPQGIDQDDISVGRLRLSAKKRSDMAETRLTDPTTTAGERAWWAGYSRAYKEILESMKDPANKEQ